MSETSEIGTRVRKVLEEKGRPALEKARKIILEDTYSEDLRRPMLHLAENLSDHLRPALISLSCEAVGGRSEATTSAGTAMVLMCSSLNIYDNIMDRTKSKAFLPTLPGKFGEGTALIVAGLVTAKAFEVLYRDAEREIPPEKRASVNGIFQEFLRKMAEAESTNLKLRRRAKTDMRGEFKVLQMQAVDIEACTKIGATIGCGSKEEIAHLARYGLNLGTMFALQDELWTALNLTVELADRIRTGSLPFVARWAMIQSEKTRDLLSNLARKEKAEPTDIKKAVDSLIEANVMEYVEKIFDELGKKAKGSLRRMGQSTARDSLDEILNVPASPQKTLMLSSNPGAMLRESVSKA